MALHDLWSFDPALAGIATFGGTADVSTVSDSTNLFANYTGNQGMVYNGGGSCTITADGFFQFSRNSSGNDVLLMAKNNVVLDWSGATKKYWIGFRTKCNYQAATNNSGNILAFENQYSNVLVNNLVFEYDLAGIPPNTEAYVEVLIDTTTTTYSVYVNNVLKRTSAYTAALWLATGYLFWGAYSGYSAPINTTRSIKDIYFLDVDAANPNRLGPIIIAPMSLASAAAPNAPLVCGTLNASTPFVTTQAKFGSTSLRGTTTTDGAIFPNSPKLQCQTGVGYDFTVEGWLYCNSTANGGWFMCHKGAVPNGFAMQVYAGNMRVFLDGWSYNGSPNIYGAMPSTAWTHVALVKQGTNFILYINGVNVGSSATAGGTIGVNNNPLYVGNFSGLSAPTNGYLDEFRISNVARYTANFTPPAAAFTPDANTMLLCHFEGTVLQDEMQTPIALLSQSLTTSPSMIPGVQSSANNDPITLGTSGADMGVVAYGAQVLGVDYRSSQQSSVSRVGQTYQLNDGTNQLALAATTFSDTIARYNQRLGMSVKAADAAAWSLTKLLMNKLTITPGPIPITQLLMHFDGTTGDVSGAGFQDTANPSRVITNSGSLPLTNAASKFGATALSANTSQGCVSIPDSGELRLTNNQTMEFFYYLRANSTTQVLAFKATAAAAAGGRIQTYQGTLVIYSDTDSTSPGGQTLTVPAAAMKTGQWQHFALVLVNGTWVAFIDGVPQAATVTSKTWGSTGGPLEIGGMNYTTGYQANAYFDELRVSSAARYANAFTPSQVASAVDANTAMLLHFEGANGSTSVTDDASASRAITVTGATAISTAQAKVGSSSLSVPSGTTYLSTPDSAELRLTGDFTIECFVYMLAVGTGYQTLLYKATTSSGFTARIQIQAGGLIIGGDTASAATITVPLAALKTNAWQHFALVSKAGNWNVYLDGQLAGVAPAAGQTFGTLAAPLSIGGSSAGAYSLNGYIDELKISNVARYSSTFTPPTQAFTLD